MKYQGGLYLTISFFCTSLYESYWVRRDGGREDEDEASEEEDAESGDYEEMW